MQKAVYLPLFAENPVPMPRVLDERRSALHTITTITTTSSTCCSVPVSAADHSCYAELRSWALCEAV
jgi:hypothetical protein